MKPNAHEPRRRGGPPRKPPPRIFPTTLWEYPSQHYDSPVFGPDAIRRSQEYAGATPAWVVWQLLMRYTREGDLVLDPMCGSGTTLDVARDLGRRSAGFDLSPHPECPDIRRSDARSLPVEAGSVDFFFVDPPYSTHIRYSDHAACIGKLDAGGDDGGRAYYEAMDRVFAEAHRVLKDRRYLAVYVSDSWRKREGGKPIFMPIGFELFGLLRRRFEPVDIVAVVRQNRKLDRGNWRKSAEEGNYFLRGFHYVLIFKKDESARRARA